MMGHPLQQKYETPTFPIMDAEKRISGKDVIRLTIFSGVVVFELE